MQHRSESAGKQEQGGRETPSLGENAKLIPSGNNGPVALASQSFCTS